MVLHRVVCKWLYNYVHFPVVNYIDSCSAQTGAAFPLAGLMLSCLGTATTIYMHTNVCMVLYDNVYTCITNVCMVLYDNVCTY